MRVRQGNESSYAFGHKHENEEQDASVYNNVIILKGLVGYPVTW
jgi:hypothetical protein